MKEGDFVYSTTNSCGPRRVEISYKEKGQSKMGPQRNLSDNDWAVFYYLVAYCKWNSFTQEDHYYIYKNSFTKASIAKTLGITAPTVKSCLGNLLREEIIFDQGETYTIRIPSIYMTMGQDVMRYLVGLYNKGEGAYYIRGCTSLFAFQKIGDPENGFTITSFANMLGCPEKKVKCLKRAEATLWFLKGRGFIDFYWKTAMNSFGNSYDVFYLKSVSLEHMPTQDKIIFDADVPKEIVDNVRRSNSDFENQIIIMDKEDKDAG